MMTSATSAKRPKGALIVIIAGSLGLLLGGGAFAGGIALGALTTVSLLAGLAVAFVVAAGMVTWGLVVRSAAQKEAVWFGVWQSTMSGTTPRGARPGDWLPRLRNQRVLWRVLVFASPLEFGLFFALGVYLVIAEPGVWWHWAELVWFPALGVLGFVQARAQVRRIDRAMAELLERQRATTDPYRT